MTVSSRDTIDITRHVGMRGHVIGRVESVLTVPSVFENLPRDYDGANARYEMSELKKRNSSDWTNLSRRDHIQAPERVRAVQSWVIGTCQGDLAHEGAVSQNASDKNMTSTLDLRQDGSSKGVVADGDSLSAPTDEGFTTFRPGRYEERPLPTFAESYHGTDEAATVALYYHSASEM